MLSESLWQISAGNKEQGENDAENHTCLQMLKMKSSLNICDLFAIVVIVTVVVPKLLEETVKVKDMDPHIVDK